MTRFNNKERLGVNFVERVFLDDFKWIPRKNLETDVGIDMIVEISNDGQPSGRLIGLQIKSGDSYFEKETETSIVFRAKYKHVDYWIKNSLPILIVIYKPSDNTVLWQTVNRSTVIEKRKDWRIDVPKKNILSSEHKAYFENLSNASALVRQLQQLLLDIKTVKLLGSGQKVCVHIERRINQSSGQAKIQLLKIIEEADESNEYEEALISEFTLESFGQIQFLYQIFPWANFEVDEVFYEAFDNYDEDEMPGYKIVFIEEKFHKYKLPIIPYSTNNETVSYRLIMTLNEFGQAFLVFYSFLETGKQLELRL